MNYYGLAFIAAMVLLFGVIAPALMPKDEDDDLEVKLARSSRMIR